MSRTYKLRRHDGSDFQGVRKEWVLVNKRGAKKFQQMVNKRCRRLDKIVISEGINEMIDDREQFFESGDGLLDDWYEEETRDDYFDPEDYCWDDDVEEPNYIWWDWDDEYYDSLYY